MIIPDVTIWIPALRPDVADHQRYRDWFSAAIEAEEPLGISELVLSGVVRILTNPRIFRVPSTTGDVLAALAQIRLTPGTQGDRGFTAFPGLAVRPPFV